jgi:hypothetical protein
MDLQHDGPSRLFEGNRASGERKTKEKGLDNIASALPMYLCSGLPHKPSGLLSVHEVAASQLQSGELEGVWLSNLSVRRKRKSLDNISLPLAVDVFGLTGSHGGGG